jgi:ATP-binding cassette subfamily B protein
MREYAGDDDDRGKVYEALEFVGLSEKVGELPLGINTILTKEFDEEGVVLSGGEMQKIALARAYANPRALLILDEPTASLDVISEKSIVAKIKDKFTDSIVIWISHRPECLAEMNYIFCLENGTIVEGGTYEELIKRKGAFYEMYQTEGR